jgi:uncharacterized cupin superfamily protein
MHPGAQELLHVIEGSLVVEVEGSGTTLLKTGEAGIIAADLVHLASNENTSASAKALVVHSRAEAAACRREEVRKHRDISAPFSENAISRRRLIARWRGASLFRDRWVLDTL